MPTDGLDPLWPIHPLRELWVLKYRAESALIAYGMLGHGYGRRRNPHRQLFYRALCDLWIDLGQALRRSTSSSSGKRGGPLVRFIRACARPALGDVPAETVVSFIKRERERRKKEEAAKMSAKDEAKR
jgi:hypothetical protein